jgi:hypothetical protein
MEGKDPRLRLAGHLVRHLSSRTERRSSQLDDSATQLFQRQQVLQRCWRQWQLARQRGWTTSAAALRLAILDHAARLDSALTQFISCGSTESQNIPTRPTLRLLLEELEQLKNEFGDVEYRLKDQVVAVTTDCITLEEVELGPFSIELHLQRLPQNLGSGAFEIIALEPNPASQDSSITHPHVSRNSLCAGDATLPISAALQEGRIADAFCLVSAVLHEYNAGSPYVSLETWNGERCQDCDTLIDSGDLCSCHKCGRQCCDDCLSRCGGCDETFCNYCLERDDEADERYCAGCRRACAACERIVGNPHCDEETGLCPACLEAAGEDPTPELLPETSDELATSPCAEPARALATATG